MTRECPLLAPETQPVNPEGPNTLTSAQQTYTKCLVLPSSSLSLSQEESLSCGVPFTLRVDSELGDSPAAF